MWGWCAKILIWCQSRPSYGVLNKIASRHRKKETTEDSFSVLTFLIWASVRPGNVRDLLNYKLQSTVVVGASNKTLKEAIFHSWDLRYRCALSHFSFNMDTELRAHLERQQCTSTCTIVQAMCEVRWGVSHNEAKSSNLLCTQQYKSIWPLSHYIIPKQHAGKLFGVPKTLRRTDEEREIYKNN